MTGRHAEGRSSTAGRGGRPALIGSLKSELALLPYTLGKLLGGLMAAVGLCGAACTLNWGADAPPGGLACYLPLCAFGFIVFVVAGKLGARRMARGQLPDQE